MTINGVGYSLAADRTWSVGTVTSVGTSAPLTGGTITGSGTIGINQSNTTTDGYLSSTDWNTFNNKQANLGYTPENLANKGINNGYASLGGDGKVPSTQLPSYVDDVVEVANFAALPATGETGKIYVTLDTDFVYRWSGTVYVRISSPNAIWGSITGTLSNQIDLQNALNAKVSSVGLDLGTSGTDVNVANSPITSSGNITLNLPTASATNRGLLSSANWTTFNNKQNALTLTTTGTSGASTLVGSTLNIPQYQPQLNGTGFVKISGTTISYDNTAYLPLSGGTLSGALNGTSATFSGLVTINGSSEILRLGTNNTDNFIAFRNSSNVQIGDIGYDNRDVDGLSIWNNNASGSLVFGAGATRRMTINPSGNLGLGVTPSAWDWVAFQTQKASINGGVNDRIEVSYNYVRSGSSNKYIGNDYATRYIQISGEHTWNTAPSGTAGNAITFTQAMTLTAGGNLGVGVLSPALPLEIFRASGTAAYISTSVGSNQFLSGVDSSGTPRLFTGGDLPITMWTNSIERMRITSSGRVLIGTPPPTESTYQLDVNGTGRFSGAVNLATSSGNVGIGTASPSEKLDVIGGALAAGNGTIRTGITYSSLGLIGTFTNHDLGIITNGTTKLTITAAGAATFSSSVSAKGLYIATGQFTQSGGTTSTFYTFDNLASNRVFMITVRQSGNGPNNVTAMSYTYGSGLMAYNLGQDNTNPVLYLTVSFSGLGVTLTTGSGYGSTTWEYTITQIK
jgi:hypothetical protein